MAVILSQPLKSSVKISLVMRPLSTLSFTVLFVQLYCLTHCNWQHNNIQIRWTRSQCSCIGTMSPKLGCRFEKVNKKMPVWKSEQVDVGLKEWTIRWRFERVKVCMLLWKSAKFTTSARKRQSSMIIDFMSKSFQFPHLDLDQKRAYPYKYWL